MKKTICLLATAIALCLIACHNNDSNAEPETGTKTIAFDVTNFQQTSLDDVTRAAAATTLGHLDMAVYDVQTGKLITKNQTTKDDEGYGQFKATLDYGQYTLVFLGYDGNYTAELDDPTDIGFTGGYVPNFFYKRVDLTVSATTSGTMSIALARAVAAFTLKHEGYIPQTLARIEITANGGGFRFNALTGTAAEAAKRVATFNAASLAGGSSFTLNYYTFLTDTETTMKFDIVATDASNEVLASHTFDNVPMKINQRSTYSGAFFGSGAQAQMFSLTLENDTWEETNHTY